MSSITIRHLEEGLKQRLLIRAADHGRSVEEEVHQILRAKLSQELAVPANLAIAIQARARTIGREAVDSIPAPDIKLELVGSQSRTRTTTQALDCNKWKKRSYWKKATGADVVACLNAGASPNAPRKVKKTPLSMAAEYNENPDVFKVLIAAGASLEAQDKYGGTP